MAQSLQQLLIAVNAHRSSLVYLLYKVVGMCGEIKGCLRHDVERIVAQALLVSPPSPSLRLHSKHMHHLTSRILSTAQLRWPQLLGAHILMFVQRPNLSRARASRSQRGGQPMRSVRLRLRSPIQEDPHFRRFPLQQASPLQASVCRASSVHRGRLGRPEKVPAQHLSAALPLKTSSAFRVASFGTQLVGGDVREPAFVAYSTRYGNSRR